MRLPLLVLIGALLSAQAVGRDPRPLGRGCPGGSAPPSPGPRAAQPGLDPSLAPAAPAVSAAVVGRACALESGPSPDRGVPGRRDLGCAARLGGRLSVPRRQDPPAASRGRVALGSGLPFSPPDPCGAGALRGCGGLASPGAGWAPQPGTCPGDAKAGRCLRVSVGLLVPQILWGSSLTCAQTQARTWRSVGQARDWANIHYVRVRHEEDRRTMKDQLTTIAAALSAVAGGRCRPGRGPSVLRRDGPARQLRGGDERQDVRRRRADAYGDECPGSGPGAHHRREAQG